MKVSFLHMAVLTLVALLPGTAPAQTADYNDLAVTVSEPVFDSKTIASAQQAYTDGGIMARKENERQRLNAFTGSTATVRAAREKIIAPLGNCYSTLTEIRRLDSRTPDYEGLVKDALKAAPAGYKAYKKEDLTTNDQKDLAVFAAKAAWEIGGALINSYNLSTERDNYASHYKTSRSTTQDTMASLMALQPASAARAKLALNKGVVVAWVTPSIANTYINDIVELRNDSGKDLTACSLSVKLTGVNAGTGVTEGDRHFHFVSYWPAGESRYLWYPTKSKRGVATDESVDVITDVDVSVLSDQIETTASFKLAGKTYDDIVKEWANKNIKPEEFGGKWYNDEDNLIDPAGFDVTYNGKLATFNAKQILVRASSSTRSETIRHSKTYWNAGETKWICHSNFNTVYPSKVEVIITFAGSSYEHVIVWNR